MWGHHRLASYQPTSPLSLSLKNGPSKQWFELLHCLVYVNMASVRPSALEDKVFIVTGAASGMGAATATTLLHQGASVGLCDISEDSLKKLAKDLETEYKNKVLTQIVNITNRTDVSTFLNRVKSHFNRLDGIANLAGTAGHRLGHEEIWQITDDEYDFVMDVNVRGAFNIISEGMKPGLLSEPGSIVHTGSMFSARGFAKGAVTAPASMRVLGWSRARLLRAGEGGCELI